MLYLGQYKTKALYSGYDKVIKLWKGNDLIFIGREVPQGYTKVDSVYVSGSTTGASITKNFGREITDYEYSITINREESTSTTPQVIINLDDTGADQIVPSTGKFKYGDQESTVVIPTGESTIVRTKDSVNGVSFGGKSSVSSFTIGQHKGSQAFGDYSGQIGRITFKEIINGVKKTILDWIPAIRDSDGKVGFWDVISKVFIVSNKITPVYQKLVWVDGIHYDVGYQPTKGAFRDYSTIVKYDTTSIAGKKIPYIDTNDMGYFPKASGSHLKGIFWDDENMLNTLRDSKDGFTIEFWSIPRNPTSGSANDGGVLGGLTWTNGSNTGYYMQCQHGNTGGMRTLDQLNYTGIGNRCSATAWTHCAYVAYRKPGREDYYMYYYVNGSIVCSTGTSSPVTNALTNLKDLKQCTGIVIYPKNNNSEATKFTGFAVYAGPKYTQNFVPKLPQLDA